MQTELLILLGFFACGAVAGLLAPRWTSPSGWAALAFPMVLPALGFWLGWLFC